jgi:hypothetical protein
MKRALYALIFAAATLIPAAAAHAQVSVAVGVGPQAIVYGTACPGPDYIWAPGYYAGTVWYPGRWIYRTYYHTYYHPYAYARPYVHYDRGYGYHGYRR